MSNSTEKQTKWHCEKCDKYFASKQKLNNHYESRLHKEGAKKYTCEMCDFVTYDKSLYTKHCSCDQHLDKVIAIRQARMEENAEFKAKIERKNKARNDKRRAKIQKEIDHISGFLKAVQGKLSNDRFVSNAPESVVILERKKESDALSKLEVLHSKLTDLG